MSSSTVNSFHAHPQALVESEQVGTGTRIWAFAHVMKGARVGMGCNICEHAFIETGAILGDGVTVKNGVAVWDGITVEDEVFLGPNCVFTNDRNPRAYIKKSGTELQRTTVCANATIGANATLLCGITIGRYAFVGAGAVVLDSVPEFGLVVGNPGRLIGWMCVCAQRLNARGKNDAGAEITCSNCQRRFGITSGRSIFLASEGVSSITTQSHLAVS